MASITNLQDQVAIEQLAQLGYYGRCGSDDATSNQPIFKVDCQATEVAETLRYTIH